MALPTSHLTVLSARVFSPPPWALAAAPKQIKSSTAKLKKLLKTKIYNP